MMVVVVMIPVIPTATAPKSTAQAEETDAAVWCIAITAVTIPVTGAIIIIHHDSATGAIVTVCVAILIIIGAGTHGGDAKCNARQGEKFVFHNSHSDNRRAAFIQMSFHRAGLRQILLCKRRGTMSLFNPNCMKLHLPFLAALAFTFAGPSGTTQAQETPVSETKPVKIVMETSKGTIELELDAAKAPGTVANFVKYVKKGHYDGTVFHRVIPDFMIQGGGFTADMNQKATEDPIQNEAKNGLKNERGTLAMARTPNPHSASSQFFINLKNNSFLDYPGQDGWGYCVFGKVSKGIEVVDAIAGVATTNKAGHQNVPAEAVTITKATVSE